jgi:hypothetical protein
MSLALTKSYPPVEALPAAELPAGPQWQYEPKWDGFRCLAFRDGKRVDLMSKSSKALTRYFPELVTALAALKAPRFVLDGEIVIPVDGTLSFDQLLMRIERQDPGGPFANILDRLSWEPPDHAAFLPGTFAPFFRASERPMAIACLRLLTVPPLPPLPDFKLPCFFLRIALATLLPAALPYFRPPELFPERFVAAIGFAS